MATRVGKTLLDTFERIRIINLPSRLDRRREITEELTRIGIFPDGDHVAFHAASRPDVPGAFPSIGARGCFESHLAVLSDALSANVKNLLILEDDCDFTRTSQDHAVQAIEELASTPWSMFYGGYELVALPPNSPRLMQVDPKVEIRTTHFIAFSDDAIELVVPHLKAMMVRSGGDPAGGPMHVDGAYSWFRSANPLINTFIAVPRLGFQRPSRTDIAHLSIWDRNPLVGALAAVVRRGKRLLLRRCRPIQNP